MASNKVPVAELRSLLSTVSEHGRQHLLEVEADLMQTTFLLSGAIEKLSASFMAIHAAVTAQQEEIDMLVNSTDLPKDATQRMSKYRGKVGEEVNAAITGLQFQDMTSQLIVRAINRVNGLRESLAALAEHGDGMETEHEHEEIVSLLAEMSANLTVRNDLLKQKLWKSVAQQDMDSGDVELF